MAILKKKVKGLKLARMKIWHRPVKDNPAKALYKGNKRNVKT